LRGWRGPGEGVEVETEENRMGSLRKGIEEGKK
jgi:hypothetical protein